MTSTDESVAVTVECVAATGGGTVFSIVGGNESIVVLLSYRGFLPRLFVEAITIELDDPTVDNVAEVVVSMGFVK